MRTKTVFFALIGAALLGVNANAADFGGEHKDYYPNSMKDGPNTVVYKAAPFYNWTGCGLGILAGGNTSSTTIGEATSLETYDGGETYETSSAKPDFTDSATFGTDISFHGGIEASCYVQPKGTNFVIGAAAQIIATNINSQTFGEVARGEYDPDYLSIGELRFGFAVDQALLYGLVGAGGPEFDLDSLVLGGGVEIALSEQTFSGGWTLAFEGKAILDQDGQVSEIYDHSSHTHVITAPTKTNTVFGHAKLIKRF